MAKVSDNRSSGSLFARDGRGDARRSGERCWPSALVGLAVPGAEYGQDPRITLLIFAVNEEASLPRILPRIPTWIDEVLLVDGNSTDRTVEITKALRPDIRVICQPGRGKGDAQRYGVQQASGDIIVTLDADGETPPEEIEFLIRPLLDGKDVVKGSRLACGRPPRMPRHRWLGNKILTLTFNLLYGTRYSDVCSGFNAFWKEAFFRVPLTHDSFQMDQQFLARAHKLSLGVKEVPHSSEGRLAGNSKTKGIKQGLIDWFVVVTERFRG